MSKKISFKLFSAVSLALMLASSAATAAPKRARCELKELKGTENVLLKTWDLEFNDNLVVGTGVLRQNYLAMKKSEVTGKEYGIMVALWLSASAQENGILTTRVWDMTKIGENENLYDTKVPAELVVNTRADASRDSILSIRNEINRLSLSNDKNDYLYLNVTALCQFSK